MSLLLLFSRGGGTAAPIPVPPTLLPGGGGRGLERPFRKLKPRKVKKVQSFDDLPLLLEEVEEPKPVEKKRSAADWAAPDPLRLPEPPPSPRFTFKERAAPVDPTIAIRAAAEAQAALEEEEEKARVLKKRRLTIILLLSL